MHDKWCFSKKTLRFLEISSRKKIYLKTKTKETQLFFYTWPLINLIGLIGLIGAPRGRRPGGLHPFSPVDAAAPGIFFGCAPGPQAPLAAVKGSGCGPAPRHRKFKTWGLLLIGSDSF